MTIYNNRTRSLLLLALLAALAGAVLNWGPLRPALAHGDAWTTKAPMPTGRQALAAAEIGDKLYAVGGVAGARLATAEVYDSTTDTWTAIASMQSARQGVAAAAVGGKLYAMGGYSDRHQNTMEVYDPATGAWTYKASMSTVRSFHAAAAINGKIYVVGGRIGPALSSLEVYDPATNTWTTKASMPTERGYLAAAAIGGKLYVVGGDNGEILATLEVYDPATNTWATKAPMPSPRFGLAAAAIDGKLYAVGGFNLSGFWLNTLEVYDPATNTWTTKAGMPTSRRELAAGVINGKLYAVGGTGNPTTLEVYEPFSNSAPVASCQNVTVSTELGCAARASIDNGSSDPDGDSITVSQSPSGPYPLGATTVTLTVTDSHGASSSCTATVTVVDDVKPRITVSPNVSVATGAGGTACGVVVSNAALGPVITSDNCGSTTLTRTGIPAGNFYPVGETLITYTVNDGHGNTATAIQVVFVADTTPPSVIAPPNVSVSTGDGASGCAVVVSDAMLGVATASDICALAGVTRSGVPAGNRFQIGTTTITYTARDGSGNTATATQTVTVTDNTPPTIVCPTPIVVDGSNALGGATVNFSVAASDNCAASPAITYSKAPGSFFAFGTTTVTATATDGSGNRSQCSFSVTVRTPQQQATAISAQVQALVTAGTLTASAGAGLTGKLNEIVAKLNRGQTGAACNQLNAFTNQVNGLINNGSLASAQGQALINAANTLKNNIGC